ncbi:MAG: hypothetical protein ACJ8H8_24680 [Geminicoccaceae bacterium]
MAVEIASERLARMPRFKRGVWAHFAVSLLCGVMALVSGSALFAGLLFLLAVVGLAVGLPLLTRYSRPRWERARNLNKRVLASSDAAD